MPCRLLENIGVFIWIIIRKLMIVKYLLTGLLIVTSLPGICQDTAQVTFTIHLNDTVQTIRNIGASGCWYSEEIGKTWPLNKKKRLAELLFSREVDNTGQPKGIGLSAFRYNIGAGTAEQGDSSGINEPARRVECFLSPDGTYNWNKQEGYTWMLKQAKNYGVENLIAFVNSPPVQFTKDGLGYKLEKDYTTNLKEDKYTDYANFLAGVIKHFDSKNLHFDYISPVNEPQWDWSGVQGKAKQEGSPWTNEEIYNTVNALGSSLHNQKLRTKILVTEAATLGHLYGESGKAARQADHFFNPQSTLYIGGLSNTTPFVEGHGYFTEVGDAHMTDVRSRLKDTLKKYGRALEYWQSEYCMLGDGFKEGQAVQKRSAIDCALYLAKIIHTDLSAGNATAWHYWNAFEPGPADSNTLYYLVALNRNRAKDTANMYSITKNAWVLGHYSLFIRPGMQRVETSRNDGVGDVAAARNVMVSAFRDKAGKKLVVNLINYTTADKTTAFNLQGLSAGKSMKLVGRYITSAKEGDGLKPYPVTGKATATGVAGIVLPARSVTSLVFEK